jgi:DNA-binding CsgD family transcriptional regulator
MTVLDDRVAASGAELVALAEHFYRRAFAGALLFVGLAGMGALAMLPLRDSASDVGPLTPTVLLTAVLVVASSVGTRFALELYRLLRRYPALQLVPVVIAAALLAYPLRSELWWPACALLMLVALVTSLSRTWSFCLAVLLVNLAAHAVAGDLDTTPAVSIVGLWVGFGFWATLSAVFTDRIASYLMRLDVVRTPPSEPARTRSDAPSEPVADAEVVRTRALPVPAAHRDDPLPQLTARQLEVIALLADGRKYADVAACMAISARQVQRHVAEAVRRLGVNNANELVAVAVACGLVGASHS